KGVFTIVEVVGFHSAAQRLRSTNCLRVIRNAWHFYYALVLVFKVVCGSFGIALLTYMVSLCFASQQFDQKCRLTTIYTAC
ncbi:TPA: hypothetical protein ACX6MG_003416, partial [Photobacterium damselae]